MFRTTEFSHVWQLIVDTYGVPTYKEANPIIVSFVTFPFLFGMMFGDMGHGSLLAYVGLYLVLKGDNDGFGMMRYLFFFMGLSAVYCGLVYNEFFALPLNLFSSCYQVDPTIDWKFPNGPVLSGAVPDMSPRSLWHPSQSQFGYGGTPYPDYGARLTNGASAESVLGPEAKQYWSYARIDEGPMKNG